MSSIKKNVAYQSFYEILILVLPFVTSPYISRVMGAEYLGIFAYTYSIAHYFQIFGLLGIKFHGNRSISKAKNNQEELNKTYSEIFALHALVSMTFFLLYIGYCFLWANNVQYSLLQGLMVLAAVFDVSWLFFGLEKFKMTVLRSTIIKLVSVACIFLFVRGVEDFSTYIVIMAGSQFLNSIVLFVMSFKYVHYQHIKLVDMKRHLKPLLILFIPILSLSIFKYMDKIMLGTIGDKIELGYYENAEKVINVPLSIVFSFGTVMLPRISSMTAQNDKLAVKKYLGLSLKYLVGLSFAMAFGMAAISSVFAPVFWGAEFEKSGDLIAMLAISMPFSTVASIVRNQDMIPNGRDRSYSYSIIAGAVVNLIINYLLIPKYQAVGVAVGTIVAEVIVCLSELWFVRKTKNYKRMLFQPLLFVVPSFIMYIIVSLIGRSLGLHVYTLLIQVVTGIIIFFGVTLITCVLLKDKDTLDAILMIKDHKKEKRVS